MERKTITVITIIELLNKISKNEVVPKQIKYRNTIYTFKEEDKTYYDENYETLLSIFTFEILNDEVEILPEENDEWEDIETSNFDSDYPLSEIGKTVNRLIKNQKYLKEKMESKDE